MDGWFVQVKGCGGDGGRSILLCGKGYRHHPQRGEQMWVGRLGINRSGAHGVGSNPVGIAMFIL